jgi:1,4-dihydroxy-2-naphthoate octaprenyltransferase
MRVPPTLARLANLARPGHLLAGFLLYSLGTAIARFQGYPIDPRVHAFGALLQLVLQLGIYALQAYYEGVAAPGRPRNQAQPEWIQGLGRLPFLMAVASLMILVTLLSVGLSQESLPPLASLFLASFAGVGLGQFLAPLRLSDSGYGEILQAMAFAGLVPALGYCMQTGEVDRLVFLSSIPLSSLLFATTIALQLPAYAQDQRLGRGSLLMRLGWPGAMRVHDAAIAFAILLSVYGVWQGYPPRVSLGLLIVLPLAAAELWQMERIRRGYPVRWRTLQVLAVSLFGVALYLHLAGYLLSLA